MCNRTVKDYLTRIIAFMFVFVILTSFSVDFSIKASNDINSDAVSQAENDDYSVYSAKFNEISAGTEKIVLFGADFIKDNASGVMLNAENAKAVNWESECGALQYTFSVPYDGLYTLCLKYLPLSGREGEIRLGVRLDGEYPFSEARELSFPRLFEDDKSIKSDSNGNELIPKQTELYRYIEYDAQDIIGRNNGAFVFKLSAGEHVLDVEALSEPFVLESITFEPFYAPEKYDESSHKKAKNYDGEPIIIEGEDALYKTAASLLPHSDTESAVIRPYNSNSTVLNYIGGTGWDGVGQKIAWRVNAPESGYYRLGATYIQNTVVNGISYRLLKIDGKIPFAEAQSWAFPYESGWKYTDFSDRNGKPYSIYLSKGEHEISLEVCTGEMAPLRTELEALTDDIGDLYIQIHMITGQFPDANRSYELFKQIPNFNEKLEDMVKRLETLSKSIKEITEENSGNLVASLNNMRRVMSIMLENPYAAHQYKSDYYNNYTTVSSWLQEMTSMPLGIDALYLQSPDTDGEARKTSLFKSVIYGFKRFINSFVNDYVYEDNDSEKLTLWLGSSFDQLQVVQSLLQDFSAENSDIEVEVKLVNTSLVQGLLSGDYPDCIFNMAHAEPVNLAIRGALLDLTQFSDFDEVVMRFRKNACLPYYYNEGCYAIPDTQGFRVQFYRTDIFKSLGLSVPKTWDEFSSVAAELMRQNMQVGLSYTSLTGPEMMSSGIATMSMFPTLLLQYGVPLYNNENNSCLLDSPDVIKVFTKLTDFYTKQGFPQSFDFYNQFRAGLMPLSIQSYVMYTTLDEMAPDIRGRWDIAPLPGVLNEDGTVNCTDAAFGTGAVIVKKSKNHKAAWELLKWWTSADTQAGYSKEMENRLGATGRQPVANVEALSRLSWKSSTLKTLKLQGEYVGEYSELPGGYYMSRAIDQSFWNVVSSGKRPKDMLYKWNAVANREIARKIDEYCPKH